MAIPTHEEVLSHFRRNLRMAVQARVEEAFNAYWKSPAPVSDPSDFRLVIKFDWELHPDQIEQAESVLVDGNWNNYQWSVGIESGCSELVVMLDKELADQYTRKNTLDKVVA